METEGKKILVNYLTDIADTFRSITGETDTISAKSFAKEVQTVATSSSKNSYQRNSIEEMNAITDAKDGDTCLCYSDEILPIIKDSTVRTITFPEEVVLENPITRFYRADISAADSSIDLWGMIDLSPNDFMFQVDKMDDQSRANAFYSSEDGITYTLNQPPDVEGSFELVNERTIDFKIDINVTRTNEYVGQFMLSKMGIFKGMYVRQNSEWININLNYPLDEYNVEVGMKYYNNGEMKGSLGETETKSGIARLNNFIWKYGTVFTYPKEMRNCFQGYEGERIPLLELNPNTSNITDMVSMFMQCPSLKTIPMLDTSNVTFMSAMFGQCSSLETIPTVDTRNVIHMNDMFSHCSSLKTIPALDTSNVIHMEGMFRGCSSLETIPMLDASSVTYIYDMFVGCSALKTFGGLKNLGKSYDYKEDSNYASYTLNLSDSPLLTHDSLMNVINNLYDIKSKGVKPQTLQLGNTNKAKLTAEEIAIATNKGWNVI